MVTPELVKEMEFPTKLVEERWARVRIYHLGGNAHFGTLSFPKNVDGELQERLENIGLTWFQEERNHRG